jgi:hypothetical protein
VTPTTRSPLTRSLLIRRGRTPSPGSFDHDNSATSPATDRHSSAVTVSKGTGKARPIAARAAANPTEGNGAPARLAAMPK